MDLIASMFTITFDPLGESGTAVVLLNGGDWMPAEPEAGGEQGQRQAAPLGLPWGSTEAAGGAVQSLAWTRVEWFETNHAGRTHALLLPGRMPWGRTARLRVAVGGGVILDLHDASLAACVPRLQVPPDLRGVYVVTQYRARAGKPVPVSGVAAAAGVPLGWYTTPACGEIELECGEL